jgi:hypothetical protein
LLLHMIVPSPFLSLLAKQSTGMTGQFGVITSLLSSRPPGESPNPLPSGEDSLRALMFVDVTPKLAVWDPGHDGIQFPVPGSLQAGRRSLLVPPRFSHKRHVRSALAHSRRHGGLRANHRDYNWTRFHPAFSCLCSHHAIAFSALGRMWSSMISLAWLRSPCLRNSISLRCCSA